MSLDDGVSDALAGAEGERGGDLSDGVNESVGGARIVGGSYATFHATHARRTPNVFFSGN